MVRYIYFEFYNQKNLNSKKNGGRAPLTNKL